MKRKFCPYLICLLGALAALALCATATSPLYGLEYGDYGGNLSSTGLVMGREWLAGKLPYRDLFVTGGPLYYALQALGWGLAGRTGVWLLEVFFLSLTLYLLYRLCRRSLGVRGSWLLTLLGAFLVAATLSGGNAREEFCLPLLLGVLALTHPGREEPGRRALALTGALTGGVLMMELAAGGLAYAALIYLLLCAFRRGGVRRLGAAAGWLALGMGAVILPFALYFALHGAGQEWLEGALLCPIRALFLDLTDWNLLLHKGVKSAPFLLAALGGLASLRGEGRREGCFLLLAGGVLFVLGLLGDGDWQHYLPLVLWVPLSAPLLARLWERGRLLRLLAAACALAVLLVGAVPMARFARYAALEDRSGYAGLMEELRAYRESYPGNEIFLLDVPAFFYLDGDLSPIYRYFANQSEYEDLVPDLRDTLNGYILEECEATILIVRSRGMAYAEAGDYSIAGMYYQGREILSVYKKNQ